MASRLHVFIAGRVQGVGFRYDTYDEAARRGLTGWVRNLPDGRVEAMFEGPEDALRGILGWCHIGPRAAKVTRVDVQWETGPPQHKGFEFRW
jgi:acylphosphatase